jgi:5'(3')-deoxyribonucleotidase
MKKKIILCDVDLTVVDPVPDWVDWLNTLTGTNKKLPSSGEISYDLGSYWREELEEIGEDGLGFWRQENLYDNLIPDKSAIKHLTALNDNGHEIRFVSHIKGNHHKSKYNFLKRWFPLMTGFAATKEKWMLYGDILIDDRLNHLASMPSHVLKIQKYTRYSQMRLDNMPPIYANKHWNEIYDIITNY